MSYPQIPEWFRSDDIIYHYTSSETAICHILDNMKLKLSPRKASIDPFENSDIAHKINMGTELGYSPEIQKMLEELRIENQSVKQICFCRNSQSTKFAKKVYPEFEKFGFSKPRMWDQYGDKYKGVCLVLSKKDILKSIKNQGFLAKNVEYYTYQKIEKSQMTINGDIMSEIGSEQYREGYAKYYRSLHFAKHVDYRNENEFRICSFSKKETVLFDIKLALKGVVVTNKGVNPQLYDSLDKIASKLEIKLYLLSFDRNQLYFSDYKEWVKMREEIQKNGNLNPTIPIE